MSRTNTYRRWTADEIAYLWKHYHGQTAAEIASSLDRTEDSVFEKAVREGLAKRPRKAK